MELGFLGFRSLGFRGFRTNLARGTRVPLPGSPAIGTIVVLEAFWGLPTDQSFEETSRQTLGHQIKLEGIWRLQDLRFSLSCISI